MASRISKSGWVTLYIVTGLIDVIQWLIDLTGIGLGVNELIDPFIGVLLAAQFQFRGVSLVSRPSRLFSLLGVTILEEISFGIAPAWILDVWYIHSDVKKENAQTKAVRQEQEFSETSRAVAPLVANGRREAQRTSNDQGQPEYNRNGTARPRAELR